MAPRFVEQEHPRGQPKNRGQFVEKGGSEPVAKQFGATARKIRQASFSFSGGRTTRNVTVFRHVNPEFAKQLDGLKRGARMAKPASLSTTMNKPSDKAMHIVLPKGSPANFLAPSSQNREEMEVQLPENAALIYQGKDKTGNYLFKMTTGEVRTQISTEVKPLLTTLSGMAKGSHEKTISPRLVTAVKNAPAARGKYLSINIAAMQEDQEQFAQNMGLFKDRRFYQQFRAGELSGKDPAQIAEAVKERVKDNLVFLFKNATEDEMKATVWYAAANKLVKDQAQKYGLDEGAVTGAFAALSPQKDWEMNIYLGHAVVDIWSTKQDHAWDKKMEATASKIWKPKDAAILHKVRGKSLGQLTNNVEKALWIRTYDETYSDRSYRVFNNDGTLGDLRKNKDGSLSKAAWQSLPAISNAVMALESKGDVEMISKAMSARHKVRSFYNNILDPFSKNDDVTVDTHAVGAGLLRAIPATSVPVWHSMGLAPELKEKPVGWKSAAKSARTGVVGTYGLFADAYRAAAKEVGVRPNELQAVVWTVKRNSLNSRDLSAADIKAAESMWTDYNKGKASLAETQKKILAFTRGRMRERARNGNASAEG